MLVRAAAALRALVLATTPSVAVPQGPEASSFETFVRFIGNTDPGSNARMPGLTIPAGLGPTTGLPVGVSLDGLPDSDERLLALGLAIERRSEEDTSELQSPVHIVCRLLLVKKKILQ